MAAKGQRKQEVAELREDALYIKQYSHLKCYRGHTVCRDTSAPAQLTQGTTFYYLSYTYPVPLYSQVHSLMKTHEIFLLM